MPADPTVSPMRGVIDNYTQDLAGLDRRYQLPGSDAEHQRLAKFFQDRLDGLSGVNFDSLDQAGKVDYLLLQNRIRFEVRELEYQKKQFDLVATLLPFAEPIVALEESRRRMEKLDSENAARTLVGADSSLAKLRKDLEAKVKSNSKELPDKVLANRAAKLTDQLREVLEHWHAFYDQYDPQFSWWMREPYPKFDKALKDYAEFLRKSLPGTPMRKANR